MLKTKVIADNILNLTDARYFAAFGVDYLSFNFDSISTAEINEIKTWIEGVQILIEINKAMTPGMMESIIELDPAGFISSDIEIVKQMERDFQDQIIFFRGNSIGQHPQQIIEDMDVLHLEEQTKDMDLYVKGAFSKESIESIITNPSVCGIVLEGGAEEKVGLKNFEELDSIFEWIEE